MAKPKDSSPEHVEYLANLARAKGFLGREFLTWLWYLSETKDGSLSLPNRFHKGEDLEVDFWVDDRLGLEGTSGYTHENFFKGGDPSRSAEAQAALRSGKTVKQLKLGIRVEGTGEFTAVLNADDLNPRSLKLPPVDKDDAQAKSPDADPEVPLMARIRQTEIFLSALDGLFAKFLEERVEESWESSGIEGVRAWVKARQKATESGTLH